MSRHRFVRGMQDDFDDDDDDDYDDDDGADFGVSPGSAQFLYNHQSSRQTSGFGSLLTPSPQKPAPQKTQPEPFRPPPGLGGGPGVPFRQDGNSAAASAPTLPARAISIDLGARFPPSPAPTATPSASTPTRPPTSSSSSSLSTPAPSISSSALSAVPPRVSTPSLPSSPARRADKQMTGARRKEIEGQLSARTAAEKVRINMIVIGHVDAGKSTTFGHLLEQLGNVDSKQMQKLHRDSDKMGKGSFKYAWVLDQHTEERERGITVDVAVSAFETKTKQVVLLDAPGHADFVSNMLSGASQADVAVLVISAKQGEFESGFDLHGQTREHATLAKAVGVSQLVVAVNKMDMCGWDCGRFTQICDRLGPFLKSTGYKPANITYVPVSGWTAENLVTIHEAALTAWYSGPTLIGAIDAFAAPMRHTSKPFRLCIADVYRGGQQRALAVGGKVEAGLVSVGDTVLVLPAGEIATVKALYHNSDDLASFGAAGDNVDLTLTGIEPNLLSIGSVLCDPEFPVPLTRLFRAQIIVLQTPQPLTPGLDLSIHVHNVHEECTLKRMVALMDKSTGTPGKRRPRHLVEKDSAQIDIRVRRSICLELYSTLAQLGRFTLRRNGKTVAVGIVIELLGAAAAAPSAIAAAAAAAAAPPPSPK